MKNYIVIMLLALMSITTLNAETIPEKPTKYYNDYVGGMLAPFKASMVNEQLAQFERDTSNQFVVVIYPYMDSNSDVADYTQRIAQKWHVGQEGKNNGLVLFIFMKSANGKGKIFTQVGYGLEGAIPDIKAHEITTDIGRFFKKKDFDAGITTGIDLFIAQAKSEHKGTNLTKAETPAKSKSFGTCIWLPFSVGLITLVGVVLYMRKKQRRLRREREERDDQERRLARRAGACPIKTRRSILPIPIPTYRRKRTVSRERKRTESNSSDLLTGVVIGAALSSSYSSDNDSSSSSSSDSSSSPSSFESGGGSFGGGGGGSEF